MLLADSQGGRGLETFSVQVNSVRAGDGISGPATAQVGQSYVLNLNSAGGETPWFWTIDWGDGGPAQQVPGGSQQVEHSYADAGPAIIRATATDSQSTQDAGSASVQVNGDTPVLEAPDPPPAMTYVLTGLSVSSAGTALDGKPQYDITGSVAVGTDPVAGALVELDTIGGGAADATTRTDDNGDFSYVYTPSSYAQQTVGAKAVEWNADASCYLFGPWVQTPFQPQLATVSDMELAVTTGRSGSYEVASDPTLWGSINCPGLDYADYQVYFQVAGSTAPPQSAPVNSGGQYRYTLQGLSSSPDRVAISARAGWIDPSTGNEVHGAATNFNFIYYVPPAAPALASLGLLDSTDPSDVFCGTDPTLAGSLDPSAPVLDNVTVQVSASSDFSAADTVQTDASGQFTDQPGGLSSSPSAITFYARTVLENAADQTPIYGPVRSFSFTCYQPPPAPAITALSVLHGTTAGGVTTASDPALTGQVNTSAGNCWQATVEFALADDCVIGTTTVDGQGVFHFAPTTLTPSATPLTILARSSLWDGTVEACQYSAWQSVTFTYVPAARPIFSITLEVSNPTGQAGGVTTATDPTVAGQVTVAGGGAAANLTVNLDTTGGGKADAEVTTDQYGRFHYTPDDLAAGSVTISAWVHAWDYTQGAFVERDPCARLVPIPGGGAAGPGHSELAAPLPDGCGRQRPAHGRQPDDRRPVQFTVGECRHPVPLAGNEHESRHRPHGCPRRFLFRAHGPAFRRQHG